jgi:adsorption protein B
VPSAGVGTCFSRRAIEALVEAGNGIAFDGQSLTEDYDIGFRLKALGMKEIFVRFPVVEPDKAAAYKTRAEFGISLRESNVVCVREYFPESLSYAVRQKSRWIIGIVYQGYKTHQWTNSSVLNYFLWRDRKGVITNFASFLAILLALQLFAIWAYQQLVPDAYQFLSIFENHAWLTTLLFINFWLMANRILQRMIFVTRYYGLMQGLLSVPRLLWGNLINFLANWRALKQTLFAKDIRKIAWDKTSHQFPSLGEQNKVRKPLGNILVEQGALTEEQLTNALKQARPGLRLGGYLVHEGIISVRQLAQAVAEQSHALWERIEAINIDADLIKILPAEVALQYAVLPIRITHETLTLASEAYVDPVSLAAISRKLGRRVEYVITTKGQVSVGLRYWYASEKVRLEIHAAHQMLQASIKAGQTSSDEAQDLWDSYVAKQVFLGDVMQSMGHIEKPAMNALLNSREKNNLPVGEYLFEEKVLSWQVLDASVKLQQTLQTSMLDLLSRIHPKSASANEVRKA